MIFLRNKWIMFLILFPHFSIYYLQTLEFELINIIWSSLVIIVAILITLTKLQVHKFSIVVSILLLLVIISSYLNGTLSVSITFHATILISVCIYLLYCLEEIKEALKGLYYLCGFIVISNLLTVMFPNINPVTGQEIYLLGGKNQVIITVTLSVCVSYLYFLFNGKKNIIPKIIIALGLLSTYLAGSGTGTVIVFLLILYILLHKKIKPTFIVLFLIYISTFLTIVIFRLQEILFKNFIVNVLHKSLTFSDRTFIWDVTIDAVKNSWLIGYGRDNNIILTKVSSLGVDQAHNGLLEISLESGVLGVLVFIYILLLIGRRLDEYRLSFEASLISVTIFLYLIIGLTESIFYRIEFWIVLILGYSILRIIDKTRSRFNVKL
ncbi:O-Antigen ligase [Terribacillus halophilus]|uniref:O-Antigen ligase n=1 Tax=Terribacillus halophilus TaxID=361279 RepID=A0A1G6IKZ0_9BACI|nr:O-Antigen ligase [Terribacillus halophilus]